MKLWVMVLLAVLIFDLGFITGMATLACALWLFDLRKEYIQTKAKAIIGNPDVSRFSDAEIVNFVMRGKM